MSSKPVLVGYDGSPGAQEALRWALDDAVHTGTPVRLMFAYEWLIAAPWIAPTPGIHEANWPDETTRHTIEATLHNAVAEAAQTHPDLAVHGEVLDGSPTTRLREESAHSSLVVLGSRGHGGFAGLLTGSTTVAVSTHAHCPVVVVRETQPTQGKPAGRIVVGVDGSECSLLALGFAFERAATRAVPLHVIRAALPPEPGWHLSGTNLDEITRSEQAELTGLLAGWRERYPNVEVTADVVAGRPAETLIGATREAQLAVLGSRGRGGFTGMLLGSVSQQLIHHSHCPVAVVRELPSEPITTGPANA